MGMVMAMATRWWMMLLLVALLTACPGAKAPTGKVSAEFDPASITMRTGAHQSASLKITNGTTEPYKINTYILENATLELIVTASDGKRMPSLSPPVPPLEYSPSDFATIPPGSDYRVNLALYDFSPPLPPGTYALSVKDYPEAKGTLVVEP